MIGEILRGDTVAGTLKMGIQFGPAFAQWRDRAIQVGFPLEDIAVNFLLVSKIKGDGSIYLLQSQRREVLTIVSGESPAFKE